MIDFANAKRVGPDDTFTSATWNSFAAAVNERILSGIGDPCERIVQFILGITRSTVVGDTDGKTHAEGEFFTYQSLQPNVGNWPAAGVDPVSGLPEIDGPNIANPIMAFVYGNKANGIDPEATRLGKLPTAFLDDSDETKWVVAQYWRGLTDPTNGLTASPVADLAHEAMRFAYGKSGLFGTTFGGYLPGPAPLSPDCTPPCDLSSSSCNIFPRSNLDVFFTATRPDVTSAGLHFDSTVTVDGCVQGHYAGTCIPCIDPMDCPAGNYDTHIAWYQQLPEGFVVMLNDGTVDFLPKNDWIEGPYTRVSALSRDLGDQLPRAIWSFLKEFRGSDGQREGKYNLDYAFDFQHFCATQYFLAPAKGVSNGETITGSYPTWTLDAGTYSAAQKLACGNGGTSYSWHPTFLATHAFAVVRGYESNVMLTVTHSTGSFKIVATPEGTIYPLETIAHLVDVEVKIDADLVLTGEQEVMIQFTELQPYKPNWWDVAVAVRKGCSVLVGAAGGEIADAFVDGQGIDEEGALVLSDEYKRTGMIVNLHSTSNISDATFVNENAVFEAFRRMSQNVRIFDRFVLLDYEVTGDGDSVVYFTPHPRTDQAAMVLPTDDGDPDIDIFSGIDVYEAPQDGMSSRWCAFWNFKAMIDNESSIWRPDTYADQYVDVSRCLFDDFAVTADQGFMAHINRNIVSHGIGAWYASAPSGWNHAQLFTTLNWLNHKPAASDDRRIRQEKSCPIYKRPVEVRRIERFTENGRDVVKVVFKGRLQNTNGETDGAPDSVPRHGWVSEPTEAGPWVHATIAAEPYRTDENAIRLYLFWRWKSEAPPQMSDDVPGDRAITSPSGVIAEGMTGSVLPVTHFVKLIPEAYKDDNDDLDETDSALMHDVTFQSEWYLRSMVEGSVAGLGTLDCTSPDSARMYDARWDNLCAYLGVGRSVIAFPTKATADADGFELIGEEDVREDAPEGFGALPNTLASSEVYNRLVDLVNSMDKYRLMLPWMAEERHTDVAVTELDIGGAGNHGCGNGSDCASTGGSGALVSTNATPPPVGAGAWSAWSGITYPGTQTAFTGHGITACFPTAPTHWGLFSNRQIVEFRFSVVDVHIYKYACDPSWRDMIETATDAVGAVFSLTQSKTWNEAGTGSYTCAGEVDPTFDCEFIERTWTNTECIFLRNGTAFLDCGENPIGGWAWLKQTLPAPCAGGSLNQMDARMISDTVPILIIPLVDRPEGEEPEWVRR